MSRKVAEQLSEQLCKKTQDGGGVFNPPPVGRELRHALKDIMRMKACACFLGCFRTQKINGDKDIIKRPLIKRFINTILKRVHPLCNRR